MLGILQMPFSAEIRENRQGILSEPLKWRNTTQLLMGTHTVTGQKEREGVSEAVVPQRNLRLHVSLL